MTDDPRAKDDERGEGGKPSTRRINRRAVAYAALALVAAGGALAWPRLRPLFTRRGVKLDPAPRVESGPLAGFELAVRYPALRFERPVFLAEAPDGSGSLWVLEQAGRIRRVKKADRQTDRAPTVLDIRDRVTREGNEEGLLGLAFHPKFAQNRTFFVYYSAKDRGPRSVVARFRLGRDGTADPDGEQVVLEVPQPYRNHNGGCLAFGPDGKLYIGLGDGGWAGDPQANGQDKGTLLGSILRIDVDHQDGERAYAIPSDNPFTGDPVARGEVWAYGLRNPWRFSFDRATGALWAGDVGQNAWEEVDLIAKGGNYGWRAYEGFSVYSPDDVARAPDHVPPLAAYGRGEGISITGGYVYRGARFPELQGRYLYADFGTGAVWALTRDPEAPAALDDPRHPTAKGIVVTKLVTSGLNIASFGEDLAGELYLCAFDGRIYGLEHGKVEGSKDAHALPTKLSRTRLFASLDPLRPARGAIPYAVNVGQWVDGAELSRFLVLPKGRLLGYERDAPWQLPPGAALVQTLSVEGRKVETRVLKRTAEGFALASYAWDANGLEALRVDDGSQVQVPVHDPTTGRTVRRPWRLQGPGECRTCHGRAAGVALGFRTAQLNRDHQLATWIGARRFRRDAQPPATGRLPRFPRPDAEAPLAQRTRAWLAASCGHCHRPGGAGNAKLDLRAAIPLKQTGLLETAVQHDLGLGLGARLVQPGEPEKSVVYLRVAGEDPKKRMPPAGATLPDPRGLELLRAWIDGLKEK